VNEAKGEGEGEGDGEGEGPMLDLARADSPDNSIFGFKIGASKVVFHSLFGRLCEVRKESSGRMSRLRAPSQHFVIWRMPCLSILREGHLIHARRPYPQSRLLDMSGTMITIASKSLSLIDRFIEDGSRWQ
jgi:hypothetical protein